MPSKWKARREIEKKKTWFEPRLSLHLTFHHHQTIECVTNDFSIFEPPIIINFFFFLLQFRQNYIMNFGRVSSSEFFFFWYRPPDKLMARDKWLLVLETFYFFFSFAPKNIFFSARNAFCERKSIMRNDE